jgi:Protein of unknown function DUF262/Protein of unknown function (DUF1524)
MTSAPGTGGTTEAPPGAIDKKIGELSGHFVVPSYQRGYRWGRHEVEALLNDVAASDGEYYLQPLVVKRLNDAEWELIDGQQRLTTLYLILRYIRGHLPTSQLNYSIEYETRPLSAAFLDEPNEAQSQDNIDFFHIFEASEIIRHWFETSPDPALAAMDIYRALASRVHVIWYEPPTSADPRTLFTRLNIGRIPLTDAELVKAVLLSRVERPEEVSAQWDGIERDLRAPELWSFLTGRRDPVATHISLLLDTLSGGPSGSSRPLFHTFEVLRDRIDRESPDSVWEAVIDLHSLMLGWYDDGDLFHKIGYLVATGSSVTGLVGPALVMTGSEFTRHLDDRVRESLKLTRDDLDELSYKSDTARCERVLLLMNVETMRRRDSATERYSFAAHASRAWSLEHIDAQSAEPLVTSTQWSEWLRLHRDALSALPDVDDQARSTLVTDINAALGHDTTPAEVSRSTFRNLEERVLALFASVVDPGDEAVHSITNLALLAGDDNSVLSNSKFEVKRQAILRLDRDGRYIPAATRNVFLKYYTGADAHQIHFWSLQDRAAYMAEILDKVQPYLMSEATADA